MERERREGEGREGEEEGPELSCFVNLHKPQVTQRTHVVAIRNGLSKKDLITPLPLEKL